MARKRSGGAALKRLLDTATIPIYLVDGQQRIVYCNAACEQWTGLAGDQLQGLRCQYQTADPDTSAQRVATALCPPPSCFQGTHATASVAVTNGRGELVRRTATFLALPTDGGGSGGVLAVLRTLDPSPPDTTEDRQQEALELHAALAIVRHEMGRRYALPQLIGVSPAIRRVRAQIELAMDHSANVLVAGPPGSGREHVARTIYYAEEKRDAGMLLPLSCPILDAELLQTTITAFLQQHAEMQWSDSAGLMLLDVDELAADAQAGLIESLGGAETGVRMIATARASLDGLVVAGQFDAELACELSTLTIQLPPLAGRREDIPLLAQAAVEDWNRQAETTLTGFHADAMDRLLDYPFPGNLDELQTVVATACEAAAGPLIRAEDLPAVVGWAEAETAHPSRTATAIDLDRYLEGIEAELIRRALHEAKGNRSQAARLLSISRPRLLRRIDFFGLGDG